MSNSFLSLEEAKDILGIEDSNKDNEISLILDSIHSSIEVSIGEISDDDLRAIKIAKTLVRLKLWDEYYNVETNATKITYYTKLLQSIII